MDESHSIKGQYNNATRSILKIRAENRWCLTGTPFGKNIYDIETQLVFIGMKQHHINMLQIRNLSIFTGKPSGYSSEMQKDRAIPLINVMKSVVMRHRKSQKFNGRPIVEMPDREEKELFIDFTAKQKEYYQKLYATAKERYEYYKAMDNIGRGTIQILSALLPARQACSGTFTLCQVR